MRSADVAELRREKEQSSGAPFFALRASDEVIFLAFFAAAILFPMASNCRLYEHALRTGQVRKTDLLFLFVALLVDTGARALTFDLSGCKLRLPSIPRHTHPVVARRLEVAVSHRPDLGADRLGELAVVRDDEDTTLVRLEGGDQRGERFSIEVVGRLVEDNDVRSAPGRRGEDDLDLLTAGEAAHGVVLRVAMSLSCLKRVHKRTHRDEFGFEPEIGHVGLDFLPDERTQQAETLRFLGVESLDLCAGVSSSHYRAPSGR